MNPINPDQLTGKWLQMTLKDLAQRAIDHEPGTKELLFSALDSIVLGLEKGYIEDAFETWIDSYSRILSLNQNIDNKNLNVLRQKDQTEYKE
jgi:hypothetical protein